VAVIMRAHFDLFWFCFVLFLDAAQTNNNINYFYL